MWGRGLRVGPARLRLRILIASRPSTVEAEKYDPREFPRARTHVDKKKRAAVTLCSYVMHWVAKEGWEWYGRGYKVDVRLTIHVCGVRVRENTESRLFGTKSIFYWEPADRATQGAAPHS